MEWVKLPSLCPSFLFRALYLILGHVLSNQGLCVPPGHIMHIPCNKVKKPTVPSNPVPSHAGLLQVRTGSELHEGSWGLPVPMSSWERHLNSSAVCRQASGMRFFFLAGLYSWIFFFVSESFHSQGGVTAFPGTVEYVCCIFYLKYCVQNTVSLL